MKRRRLTLLLSPWQDARVIQRASYSRRVLTSRPRPWRHPVLRHVAPLTSQHRHYRVVRQFRDAATSITSTCSSASHRVRAWIDPGDTERPRSAPVNLGCPGQRSHELPARTGRVGAFRQSSVDPTRQAGSRTGSSRCGTRRASARCVTKSTPCPTSPSPVSSGSAGSRSDSSQSPASDSRRPAVSEIRPSRPARLPAGALPVHVSRESPRLPLVVLAAPERRRRLRYVPWRARSVPSSPSRRSRTVRRTSVALVDDRAPASRVSASTRCRLLIDTAGLTAVDSAPRPSFRPTAHAA